jgi:virginiamycin A acetyltransferase
MKYIMSIEYGNHSYGTINIRSWTDHTAVIKVGSFCSFAENVVIILDGNHYYNRFSTFPFRERLGWDIPNNNYGKSIPTIGNDVWIGMNVTIMSGVKIGDGAIIGAGTVVTKDVPPYAIFCGNPGQIKKYRFSHDIIEDLLKYPWWNLPDHLIRNEILPTFHDITSTISILKEIYELYGYPLKNS